MPSSGDHNTNNKPNNLAQFFESAGFSYIEVLMAVMILALALVPLLSQFYVGFQGNINAEIVTQATDLANDLMEEIKGRRFDENEFPDEPVSSASFGTDFGEDPANRSTFDDVDDYDNWSQSPPEALDGTVLSDFDKFTRSVQVDYVRLNVDTWQTTGSSTYYKRIIVRVTHPKLDEKTVESIISHY
jgi:MSHA pilin protein MshD